MPMRVPLSEAVVVVTGASSGLGAAIACRAAERHGRLVLAGRDVSALESTAKTCRELGGEVLIVPTEATDPAAMDDLAAAAESHYGRLDAWINNAAISEFGGLLELPLDEVRRVVEVNLFGYLYGARAAIPRLRATGGGVLVMVGSVLSQVCVPYQGPYVMAKHGLLGLSGTLRQELAVQDGSAISVCDVLPASMDTPLYANAGNRTGRRPRPLRPVNSPKRLANRVVRLLEAPRRQVYIGLGGRGLGVASRIAPATTERTLGWWARRNQFEPGQRTTPSRGNLRSPGAVTGHVNGGWGALLITAAIVLWTTLHRTKG